MLREGILPLISALVRQTLRAVSSSGLLGTGASPWKLLRIGITVLGGEAERAGAVHAAEEKSQGGFTEVQKYFSGGSSKDGARLYSGVSMKGQEAMGKN